MDQHIHEPHFLGTPLAHFSVKRREDLVQRGGRNATNESTQKIRLRNFKAFDQVSFTDNSCVEVIKQDIRNGIATSIPSKLNLASRLSTLGCPVFAETI